MNLHLGAAPARRARGIAWLAAFAALACAPGGYASVAVYVGKNLTKDGGVILAGFGDEPSSHWLSIVPRRQHAAGETISVGGTPAAAMPGELITIPQVHETFRYIAMEYSYYRGLPAPLINGGLNEYRVAVRGGTRAADHCGVRALAAGCRVGTARIPDASLPHRR